MGKVILQTRRERAVLRSRGGVPKGDGQIKGQMAKGKYQTVFHLPFALCRLNFEFLFCSLSPSSTFDRARPYRRQPQSNSGSTGGLEGSIQGGSQLVGDLDGGVTVQVRDHKPQIPFGLETCHVHALQVGLIQIDTTGSS